MKRKGAQGLPSADSLIPAANEEFATLVDGLDELEQSRAGWDPYEVWRTRVKGSSRTKSDREQGPLR